MKYVALIGIIVSSLSSNEPARAAAELKAFDATCVVTSSRSYRSPVDNSKASDAPEWTEGEFVNSKWEFEIRHDDTSTADGREAVVTGATEEFVTLIQKPGFNGVGSTIWIYALGIKSGRAIGTQVNAATNFFSDEEQLKLRSVVMDCLFSRPT